MSGDARTTQMRDRSQRLHEHDVNEGESERSLAGGRASERVGRYAKCATDKTHWLHTRFGCRRSKKPSPLTVFCAVIESSGGCDNCYGPLAWLLHK